MPALQPGALLYAGKSILHIKTALQEQGREAQSRKLEAACRCHMPCSCHEPMLIVACLLMTSGVRGVSWLGSSVSRFCRHGSRPVS